MSNEKKNATLGMPHGTATGRLRKNILFDLLQRHGENICIRCLQFIETAGDLSIEHVKPWEGVSADLFWDLKNIAFSHLKCNVPHIYHGGAPRKKVGPSGTAWCGSHKQFLPAENFYKDSTNANGFRSTCKSCYDRKRRTDFAVVVERQTPPT